MPFNADGTFTVEPVIAEICDENGRVTPADLDAAFADTAGGLTTVRSALYDALAPFLTSPGDFPQGYDLDGGVIALTGYGQAVRYTGPASVIPITRTPFFPEEKYTLTVAYSRTVDSGDPNNDGVRFGVEWYNATGALIKRDVIETDYVLFVKSLLKQRTIVVGDANTEGREITIPFNARYGRPFFEVFGTGHETNLHRLGLRAQLPSGIRGEKGEQGPTSVSPSIDIIGTSANISTRPQTAQSGQGWVTTDDGKVFVWGADRWNEIPTSPSLSASAIIWPNDYTIPPTALPPDAPGRSFYVSMNGNDANNGTSSGRAVATVGRGLELAAAAGQSCTISVSAGDYVVQPDTVVPANCVLAGDDLRSVNLSLPQGAEENIMLRLSSGCRVTGFSFRNIRQPEAVLDQENRVYTPPETGFACGFAENAIITRSPYVSNCSVFNNLTIEQMRDPIDREAGNPFIPRVGGCVVCDGNVLNSYTPLRSIVVDSFTAINPNGVPYVILRNGFMQLVSIFTNWSRVGIWAHLGGHVTITNSNNSFGDYALASTGFRNVVEIPLQIGQPRAEYPALRQQIMNESATIIDEFWNQLLVEFPRIIGNNPALEMSCRRDAALLLDAIGDDVASAQDSSSKNFIYAFFDWNAEYNFNDDFLPQIRRSWTIIRERIAARCPAATIAAPMLDSLFAMLDSAISNPQRIIFESLLEATGQQFSYVGAGVNFNALPVSQRGTGRALSRPERALVSDEGGRINATFGTEVGDTYLGEDLRVDFERSVVEGQSFERGVANTTLPLILAIGGSS